MDFKREQQIPRLSIVTFFANATKAVIYIINNIYGNTGSYIPMTYAIRFCSASANGAKTWNGSPTPAHKQQKIVRNDANPHRANPIIYSCICCIEYNNRARNSKFLRQFQTHRQIYVWAHSTCATVVRLHFLFKSTNKHEFCFYFFLRNIVGALLLFLLINGFKFVFVCRMFATSNVMASSSLVDLTNELNGAPNCFADKRQ